MQVLGGGGGRQLAAATRKGRQGGKSSSRALAGQPTGRGQEGGLGWGCVAGGGTRKPSRTPHSSKTAHSVTAACPAHLQRRPPAPPFGKASCAAPSCRRCRARPQKAQSWAAEFPPRCPLQEAPPHRQREPPAQQQGPAAAPRAGCAQALQSQHIGGQDDAGVS